jgi:DNA mismatch repair protein PMS2
VLQNVVAPTLRGMSSHPTGAPSDVNGDKELDEIPPTTSCVVKDSEAPLKRKDPELTWSLSPEPRKRTRSTRSASPDSLTSGLAPRPFGTPTRPPNGLVPNGLLPGTPSAVRALPSSHFTPTDRKVLEYEEEDDELMGSQSDSESVARPDSGVVRAVSISDSDEEEQPKSGKSDLVQPTLTGLGARWKLTRQRDDTGDARGVSAAKPTKRDTKLSFRDRLAGFASQQAKVDTTIADSDSEEGDVEQEDVSRITRTVEVDLPDMAGRNEPNSEGIDMDIEEMLEDEDETPHENVISTNDLPDIGLPSRPSDVDTQGETQDPIQYIADTSAAPDETEKRRVFRDEIATRASKREVVISCDLDRIRKSYKKVRQSGLSGKKKDSALARSRASELLPAAGVLNQDSTEVDRTLSRVIKKQDFAGMQIIGQYNKAFIIARRQGAADDGEAVSDDLFIIG